ncbi:hypothetical protein [Streptomyces sp. YGL11-2]|uniref:hypothetical protein n=1 Tax=Streptomyces sp. YGL11-2 TaxID=3414028 RepID=UPI003CFAD4CE
MTGQRVVIVTGGGTGIGVATARQLRTETADRRMARFAQEAQPAGGVDAAYAEASRLNPAGRPAEPEEIAEAISRLVAAFDIRREPREAGGS